MKTLLAVAFAFFVSSVALLPAQVNAQASLEAFNKAVELDDVREIGKLLARGVDPNTQDVRGDHGLVVAARAGAFGTVKALVAGKAKVNLRTRVGDTALMVAALNGHMPIVKFLRDNGGDVNNDGWTALHYATFNGHTEIVKYLLAQGANPIAAAPNGVTVLHIAARGGFDDIAKELLEYGADPLQKNQKGEDAIVWAVQAEQKDIEKLLRKAAAVPK